MHGTEALLSIKFEQERTARTIVIADNSISIVLYKLKPWVKTYFMKMKHTQTGSQLSPKKRLRGPVFYKINFRL